jgi:predicted RNA binding protein YcfA (HicA-like mRNA interferase family)
LTYVLLRITLLSRGGFNVIPKEVRKLLRQRGRQFTEGKKHDLATNPEYPGVKIPIPRHTKDIPPGTLHQILKAAGLK